MLTNAGGALPLVSSDYSSPLSFAYYADFPVFMPANRGATPFTFGCVMGGKTSNNAAFYAVLPV